MVQLNLLCAQDPGSQSKSQGGDVNPCSGLGVKKGILAGRRRLRGQWSLSSGHLLPSWDYGHLLLVFRFFWRSHVFGILWELPRFLHDW